uniref:Uncharacterized protein n=1 Tax=Anguilla anguilla TaxID=7936 RepID=A0A0E9RLT8_ANGAN
MDIFLSAVNPLKSILQIISYTHISNYIYFCIYIST